MLETAVVIDVAGRPLYWHTPLGRTAVYLPDSRELWEVLWEHRARVLGVAHTHPWAGRAAPSHEDLTTFAAVESGLGRRLAWWIATDNQWAAFRWLGPDRLNYGLFPMEEEARPTWMDELRRLSRPDELMYGGVR